MRWEIRKREEEMKQKLNHRKQLWFTIFIISKYYTRSLHLYRVVYIIIFIFKYKQRFREICEENRRKEAAKKIENAFYNKLCKIYAKQYRRAVVIVRSYTAVYIIIYYIFYFLLLYFFYLL